MRAFELNEAIAVLARTPATLDNWLRALPAAWINAREEDGWTPYEVVGHLICGEEHDWIPRAHIILEHGAARAFEPFDRTLQERLFGGWSLDDLLTRFATARGASLAALLSMGLSEADLRREGRHPDPEFGPVTMSQLLATWVAHDLSHLQQIARIQAKEYREAVGPWRRYLPIMERR